MSYNTNNYAGDITLCFTGDWMLGRDLGYNSNTFDSKFITHNLRQVYGKYLLENYMRKCDLLIGNLETTITNHNEKEPKTFNFRVREINMGWLKPADRMFFSIANNHILDYGVKGMEDTKKNLDTLKIKYAGAGKNLKEARQFVTYNIKGKRIGILCCADQYEIWAASDKKPGLYYVDYDDYRDLVLNIIDIKRNLDFLILSIHWGGNYSKGLKTKYQSFANSVMKAGVDIIHGHSSHHVKCIRHNTRKMIIYGNGDFINDYAIDHDHRSDLSMLIKVILHRDNTFTVSVVPTQIRNKYVTLSVKEGDRRFICEKIKNDCDKESILSDLKNPFC